MPDCGLDLKDTMQEWNKHSCGQLVGGFMQLNCSLWQSKMVHCCLCWKLFASPAPCHNCLWQVKQCNMSPLFCFFLILFCSPSAVFSVSLHASMSATLPAGFWFMNPILLCHYCLQKEALMGQYVASGTVRIASFTLISWIFFWQPVACRSSRLSGTKWNITSVLEILGYFIFSEDHFIGSSLLSHAVLNRVDFERCHIYPHAIQFNLCPWCLTSCTWQALFLSALSSILRLVHGRMKGRRLTT